MSDAFLQSQKKSVIIIATRATFPTGTALAMNAKTNLRIIFQGGPRHGDVEIACPGDKYYFLASGGQIGARFREPSKEPMKGLPDWLAQTETQSVELTPEQMEQLAECMKDQGDVYEIIRRDQSLDGIVIRAKFVGKSDEKNSALGTAGAVKLRVTMYLPGDRPNADDLQAQQRIIARLEKQRVLTDMGSGNGFVRVKQLDFDGTSTDVEEDRNFMFFSGWCKDDSATRPEISDIIRELLPGVEFTIETAPDDILFQRGS